MFSMVTICIYFKAAARTHDNKPVEALFYSM